MSSSIHQNCQQAISNHRFHPESSNVNTQYTTVHCPHTKSTCNWVGNGIHFACLVQENTSETPTNVYDTLSGGNQSILSGAPVN